MTYTVPLRRTILHFEQRFLTDEETFIFRTPSTICRLNDRTTTSRSFHYTSYPFFRPVPSEANVNICGPFSVTAMVCSKWAVKDPSCDATVHWSGKICVR